MEIKKAIDWSHIESDLRSELFLIGYNADLKKMLVNIAGMVKELSKAEVEARRIHSDKYIEDQLNNVNAAIKHLGQFLLIAKLMK